MPKSYTQLSTYNLLQNKKIYCLIDEVCRKAFSDWDISAFERTILGGKNNISFSEADVRSLINDYLLKLDAERPNLCYLEQGKHYGDELFRSVPDSGESRASFKLLWAYLSRVFSEYLLPIDEKELRNKYLAEIEKFGIKQQSNRDKKIPQFAVNDGDYTDAIINEKDVRYALYTIEARNRGFGKRIAYSGEQMYLEKAKKIIEDKMAIHNTQYWTLKLRDDFDIHTLCYAIDSSSTEKQRNGAFMRWGIFSGETLSYAECGRRLSITGKCVIQSENAVLRHLFRDKEMLFEWIWNEVE